MLQRDRQIRTQVHQLADAGLFVLSFWLAYVLRDNRLLSTWLGLDTIGSDMFLQIRALYFLPVLAAPLILESQGFYNRPQNGSRLAMLWPLFKGCLFATLGLVLVVFMLREVTPRGVPVFFGVISFCLVWAKEELIHLVQHSRLAKEQYKCRVILAGSSSELTRLRQMVRDDSLGIVAEFNLADSPKSRLIELIHAHSANSVLLSTRHVQLDRIEMAIQLCETEGVEAWLTMDLFATKIAHACFDQMSGHPLIVFRSAPETSWPMLAKLLLDFLGSLLLVVAFSWLMAIIALLIKFTSPGPVLFRQPRSGLNGKPFTIYKFRTMVTNAEQFKHELAALNEMSGPVFKVTNDPRITSVGKWLRKYSLDELPQLFNILRGEMSLVGPRPLPVDEVKRFNDLAHRRRLSVKPGLTCLWQISGRNQISDFKEWVRLDLEYIDHWSIWLDLKILLRTIPVVLIGTGAK
jgi:exopolysaccharide biosynthesis polyprenyl glycosylphosphotransferase